MQDKATALAVIGPATLPPAIIEAELHRASDYARASRSKGTLAAYESDWRSFVARGLARCRPRQRLVRAIWRARLNGI